MKKYIITLVLMFVASFIAKAQQKGEQVFTSVPVTNGKVIFRQFIYTGSALSPDQKYTLLTRWANSKFRGNPHLISMRFNDNDQSITVNSKVDFSLPANPEGKHEKIRMNYRFDASITDAGCIVVVRDITYQKEGKNSSVSEIYRAEEMITDTAIASSSGEIKEMKLTVQKQTLNFLNELYHELSSIFETEK